MNNIVTAAFGAFRQARTRHLYQWDYGIVLRFAGLDLPTAYTVHFSNQPLSGEAKTQVGDADGVVIPDEYLTTGSDVYAWVYLHTSADDGETVYMVTIPVTKRPKPTEEPPTPVQQGVIDQAIAALNAAVEQTTEDAEAAQTAQEAAETARDAAVTACDTASGAATAADESARQAAQSAEGAEDSADAAAASESAAADSAEAAAESARSADESADRAEQAAKDAGYMFFNIDERGHLIYQRTSNTQVDFYLDNGHLYVKGVA